MKKLSVVAVYFVTFFMVTLLLSSCGTRKVTTTPTGMVRQEVKENECQKKSYEHSNKVRGFGIGVSLDKQYAIDIANLEARKDIVNRLETSISNVLEKDNGAYGSVKDKEIIRDYVERSKQHIRSVSERILKGSVPICMKIYIVGNEYEANSCVEINDDIIKEIVKTISNDDKIRIDYDAEKFRRRANEELEAFRKRRALEKQ